MINYNKNYLTSIRFFVLDNFFSSFFFKTVTVPAFATDLLPISDFLFTAKNPEAPKSAIIKPLNFFVLTIQKKGNPHLNKLWFALEEKGDKHDS